MEFENRDILKWIAIIAWLSLLIWKTDWAIAAFVAGTFIGSMLFFVEPRYVGILAVGIYVPVFVLLYLAAVQRGYGLAVLTILDFILTGGVVELIYGEKQRSSGGSIEDC